MLAADSLVSVAATDTTIDLEQQLMTIWQDFEQRFWQVPIVKRLDDGTFDVEDYKRLLRNLRPQVVEGARWLSRAASNMTAFELRSLFIGHSQEEHRDYQILEKNYISVGGIAEDIVQAEKNVGSEALSAFIFYRASLPNPIDILGSIFIIEGLGKRVAGRLADKIKTQLNLEASQVTFLSYHADNDDNHIEKVQRMLRADWMTPELAKQIAKTAQVTARLYLLQLEEIQ